MVKQPVRHAQMVRRSAMKKESHSIGIVVMVVMVMGVEKVVWPVAVSGCVLKPA